MPVAAARGAAALSKQEVIMGTSNNGFFGGLFPRLGRIGKRRRNKSDKTRLKAERRPRLEYLESRQLLSVSVPPVLTSSANPAYYGSSVNFVAKMPTNATGDSVTIKNGTSTLATGDLTLEAFFASMRRARLSS
jgi:hypothetical protein